MNYTHEVFKEFKHMDTRIQDEIKEFNISNNPTVYSQSFIADARKEMNDNIQKIIAEFKAKAIAKADAIIEDTKPQLPKRPEPKGITTQEKLLGELLLETKRTNDIEYFKRTLPKKNVEQLKEMLDQHKDNYSFYEILEDELDKRDSLDAKMLKAEIFEQESPHALEMLHAKQAIKTVFKFDGVPTGLDNLESLSQLSDIKNIQLP